MGYDLVHSSGRMLLVLSLSLLLLLLFIQTSPLGPRTLRPWGTIKHGVLKNLLFLMTFLHILMGISHCQFHWFPRDPPPFLSHHWGSGPNAAARQLKHNTPRAGCQLLATLNDSPCNYWAVIHQHKMTIWYNMYHSLRHQSLYPITGAPDCNYIWRCVCAILRTWCIPR